MSPFWAILIGSTLAPWGVSAHAELTAQSRKTEMATIDGVATISCPLDLVCDDENNNYDWRAYDFSSGRVSLWVGFQTHLIGNYDSAAANASFRRVILKYYFPDRETPTSRYYSYAEIDNIDGSAPTSMFSFLGDRVLSFALKGVFETIRQEPKSGICANADMAGIACTEERTAIPYELFFRIKLP